jgi:hypothetical protein
MVKTFSNNATSDAPWLEERGFPSTRAMIKFGVLYTGGMISTGLLLLLVAWILHELLLFLSRHL